MRGEQFTVTYFQEIPEEKDSLEKKRGERKNNKGEAHILLLPKWKIGFIVKKIFPGNQTASKEPKKWPQQNGLHQDDTMTYPYLYCQSGGGRGMVFIKTQWTVLRNK